MNHPSGGTCVPSCTRFIENYSLGQLFSIINSQSQDVLVHCLTETDRHVAVCIEILVSSTDPPKGKGQKSKYYIFLLNKVAAGYSSAAGLVSKYDIISLINRFTVKGSDNVSVSILPFGQLAAASEKIVKFVFFNSR